MNNKEKAEFRALEFISSDAPHILKEKDLERLEYLRKLKGNEQF